VSPLNCKKPKRDKMVYLPINVNLTFLFPKMVRTIFYIKKINLLKKGVVAND
jgi:hypothetical protein